ncbi:hypothetical protein V8E53_002899 [Lactarius tabidus]
MDLRAPRARSKRTNKFRIGTHSFRYNGPGSKRQACFYSCQLQRHGPVGNEIIKSSAMETLWKYGVDSCGPPYVTVEASTFYSQEFLIILFMIYVLENQGDIITANWGINSFRRAFFRCRVITLAGPAVPSQL